MIGVAAAFSPRPDGAPELPCDPRTGQIRPEVWDKWLAWDPVRMLDRYADAVRGLHSIWIDAGTRDEHFLDLGAVAFRDGLDRIGVPEDRVYFELFNAGHGGIDYRYPTVAGVVGSSVAAVLIGGAEESTGVPVRAPVTLRRQT